MRAIPLFVTVLLVLTVSLVLSSCNGSVGKDNAVTNPQTPGVSALIIAPGSNQNSDQFAAAARAYAAEKKAEYQEVVAAKLDEYNRKIMELSMLAERESGASKQELLKHIQLLKQKNADARRGLDAVKAANADAWQYVRASVDASLTELHQGYESTKSRFQKLARL